MLHHNSDRKTSDRIAFVLNVASGSGDGRRRFPSAAHCLLGSADSNGGGNLCVMCANNAQVSVARKGHFVPESYNTAREK